MTVLVQHGARLWAGWQNAINCFFVHCWFLLLLLLFVRFVWVLVFLLLCTIRHSVLQGRNCCLWQRSRFAGLCLAEQCLRATGKKQTSQTGGHDALKVISAGLSPGDDLNFGTAAMRCFHSEAPIWVFRQLQFLCRGLCYLRETSGWPEGCLKKIRHASRPQAARALQHNKAVTRWKKSSSL